MTPTFLAPYSAKQKIRNTHQMYRKGACSNISEVMHAFLPISPSY